MDPLVKINIGAAPNDGTGDPARDAFMKHNKNMDIIANALGAASGFATLGPDGRLLPGQAAAVQTLPTTAHDLNSYQLPGAYRQASTAGATSGANYPVQIGGLLQVEGTGVAGQTVQRYTVASTGPVAPTSGPRRYWRFAINTTWSPWMEVATTGNVLPYVGSMEAAQDLNTYTQRGIWVVTASSVAQGGTNFPIGQSGVLLVYSAGYPGGTAATGANQVYIASNSNRQYFRSLVGGNWSAWEEVVRSSLLGASQGVGTLDTSGRSPIAQYPYSAVVAAGTDANTLWLPGLYYVNSDAQATAALNWPQQLAGTLEVEAAAGGNAQVTQTYTTRNGTGGVLRRYVRARFGTGGGTWGQWFEMGRYDHGQCRFIYSSTTACVLMPYNGNGLLINGRQYRIPAAGVTLSNSGLAANTVYLVFARDDGSGGIALEARAGVSHVTHTDGVEILSGDASRTLVGMVATVAGGAFAFTAANRRVASWFNRRTVGLFEANTPSNTTSTSYAQLTTGVNALMWSGETAALDADGVAFPTSAPNVGAYLVLAVNGTAIGGGAGYSLGATGSQMATGVTTVYTANADSVFTFAPYGLTSSAAGPITFRQDLSVKVSM